MFRLYKIFKDSYQKLPIKQFSTQVIQQKQHGIENDIIRKYPNEINDGMLSALENAREAQNSYLLLNKVTSEPKIEADLLKKYPNEITQATLDSALKQAETTRKHSSVY